jgi:hypothetical protein
MHINTIIAVALIFITGCIAGYYAAILFHKFKTSEVL